MPGLVTVSGTMAVARSMTIFRVRPAPRSGPRPRAVLVRFLGHDEDLVGLVTLEVWELGVVAFGLAETERDSSDDRGENHCSNDENPELVLVPEGLLGIGVLEPPLVELIRLIGVWLLGWGLA